MEFNSTTDIDALTEFQRIEKIQSIEKKIHKLSFVPVNVCLGVIIWAVYVIVLDSIWSPLYIILIALAIGSVGYSNVRRTDLLMQLFDLKYDK